MSLSRKIVPIDSRQYYFDIVSKDKNTYAVQISDSSSQLIVDLPLDPMDNTLAAVIDKEAISKLGKDSEFVLNAFSKFLQEEIGAKEFVLVPNGVTLPDYLPAQSAEFKRLRHASRIALENSSAITLEQHKELVAELDAQYEIVMGIKEIEKKLPHNKPYEEILSLLNNHANFTPGKMNEYKDGEIEGAKARFNNSQVTTIAIVNKQTHRLSGLMRSLSMGNKFAYLSDEVVNQEILALDKFKGNTDDERAKNRNKFFIAYLTNKHCSLEREMHHFLLIAPDGRVDLYDQVGLQKFPIESDYIVTMKLAPPGLTLKKIKEDLCKPAFSNAAAMSNLGVIPSPAQNNRTQQVAVEPQATIKYNQ